MDPKPPAIGLRFTVERRDDVESIGRGHHERFVIDVAKFLGRVEAKAKR